MKHPLTAPKFPDDFRVLHADGGASYWAWHPDMPPDYDGTWPVGEDPPPWAGGLHVSTADGPSAELDGELIVVWEYAPELESGPFEKCSVHSLQWAIDRVVAARNEEYEMSSPTAA